jgi:signal transduction histidine kinase
MKLPGGNSFDIGPRLTLTFAALIALILGGNGLLLWQFHIARSQTELLTDVSQQLVAVLRFQQSLLLFHQRLDELAELKDAPRLVAEAKPLRETLVEQSERARVALGHLPTESRMDPAFIPTLEAIETTLPAQLEAIEALATAGDWNAVRLRVSNELKPLETQTSALVNSIDEDVSGELAASVANMRDVQRKILVAVPGTAMATFFAAAFFGWAITRRISELRMLERVNERTRIARELHDTLLQGLISVRMQLDIAVDQMSAEVPAKKQLTHVLQIMGTVVEEGRNTLQGFRSIPKVTQDLERALSDVPAEMGARDPVDCRVIVEGRPRSLNPVIWDEVYSIGREALVNSLRHSGASRIEVELEYAGDELRVLVRDDGRGIDRRVLEAGRSRHWGLLGMRERAEKIGAKLRILSGEGVGTEIELSVPGAVAFDAAVLERRAG